jgi:hypothetical protein
MPRRARGLQPLKEFKTADNAIYAKKCSSQTGTDFLQKKTKTETT